MPIRSFVACVCLAATLAAVASAAEPAGTSSDNDWLQWRGPRHDGTADPNQKPPLEWSATQNIVWKTPVPGRGHGSATIAGNRVFLAAADREAGKQWLMAFDRGSGKELWRTMVHEGNLPTGGNEKSTLASSTPASDGQRVFINFINGDAAYTSALSLDGELLWQTKLTPYVIHQGYGSSPTIHGPLVIASADNKGGGAIVGMDRESGKIVWRRERPAKPNYSSPIVLRAAGRDQLILTGCDLVTSLDPTSGEEIWEIEGATTECVTTPITDGKAVFATGGYPRNFTEAIAADGSGKTVWEIGERVYVPSLLFKDGYLYATLDGGIAVCRDASTGKEVWKKRLGGTFSSSPVLVGDMIYATNEEGETFIFKASPESYQQLAKNDLGDSVFATPTIVGGRIYNRVAFVDGQDRQEYLVCIGEGE